MTSKRNAYLGKDSVVYYVDKTGYCIIAPDPSHPAPEGFERRVAETAPDAEKLWKKMNDQEVAKISRMNEFDFKLRENKMIELRRNMEENLSHSTNAAEKAFIGEALKALENKWKRLQSQSVYGVSFMQSTEAPLAPSSQMKVTIN